MAKCKALLTDIRSCNICQPYFEHPCKPIVQFSPNSQVAIIGQAPGNKLHSSGIPWDDKSGQNLRNWLGVTESQFYNPSIFALVPMGFCFPGTKKGADLPPLEKNVLLNGLTN